MEEPVDLLRLFVVLRAFSARELVSSKWAIFTWLFALRNSAPLRTAIYVRVGTPSISQVTSRALLEMEYRKRAESLPHSSVVGFYFDEGSDDTDLTRLLSDCMAGKVDLVYTRSVMRFARSFDEISRIIEQFRQLSPPVGILFFENGLYTLHPKSEELWQQFLDLIGDEAESEGLI